MPVQRHRRPEVRVSASSGGDEARDVRLLDVLPNAVVVFDEGELAYANPIACELLDLEPHSTGAPREVLGSAELARAVREAAETGEHLELEVEVADRHLAVRVDATAPGEVVVVFTDLTDLRRVEALRRDFVTNASHELKTPTAGILALSESLTLALERDPERARTMIERLQSEAERLGQLVRDLLDLTRLEERDDEEERQRVDLANLVAAQADRLAGLARRHRVTIEVEADAPAVVVGRPVDLRLVVANLLENAVQYNRPGGVVRVQLRRRGDTVDLTVADTGVGIAPEHLDRVFERFYRVDKARSRAAGGTGLGLSIARHAVQRHGGTIRVDSTVGTGTTFHVRLPVADS